MKATPKRSRQSEAVLARVVTDAPAIGATRVRLSPCRIILGGHSFIAPLGRDVEPSHSEKSAIVAACMLHGVRVFDTTYAPERAAFATALAAGASSELRTARPIIWNFFGPLTDPLPAPLPWNESRFCEALTELMPWKGPPGLVVHAVDNVEENRAQIEAAARWKREGRIAALGTWPDMLQGWSDETEPFLDFVVGPWNVASASKTRSMFEAARERGLVTVATSPFTRGWELDRLAKRLAVLEQRPITEARSRVADALFRFAAFAPEVDHLIVAMRSSSFVSDNFTSLARGPLTPQEHRRLAGLIRAAAVR